MLGQGISMALMSAIVSLGTVILQYSINGMGYLTIAGHITARRVMFMFLMPTFAAAISMPTFVSQNRGAGKIDRIHKGVRYVEIFSICWGILSGIVILFIADPLVSWLSGSDNTQLVSTGATYLKF